MNSSRKTHVPSVDEVRARFEEWRQTRKGKARIPDELWSAAVEVARREGVNRTAAALGLDGGKLKRYLVGSNSVSSRAVPSAFVELMASEVSGLPEYTIELEGRTGKLRILCKGVSVAELAELSRSL
jgi:2-hydroxychromene-2-carboxylate isomerase